MTMKSLKMRNKVKEALISELEVVVDQRKENLQKAIDEGATNLGELTKRMVVAAVVLLLVYLFLEYKINKNTPRSRFMSRILPLITLMIRNGTGMVLSDLFSKVVDYLDLKQSEGSDEKPNSEE